MLIVLLSYAVGILDYTFLMLFVTLAVFYGVFLSTAGIFLEELTYKRYPAWGHLFRLLLYGVFENFGYRQMNSFWRLQALIKYLIGRREWEYVKYKGMSFNQALPSAASAEAMKKKIKSTLKEEELAE